MWIILCVVGAIITCTCIVLAGIINGQAECGERCFVCMTRFPEVMPRGTRCPACVAEEQRRLEDALRHFEREHNVNVDATR